MEAFGFLKTLIESSKVNGRKVVFIDELPFMYTNRCDLVVALEHFWNDCGCTQDNLMLIVCGSATSWITKKILRNKGGLHNRVTGKIYLRPFNLAECKAYFKSAGISLDEKDIAECYMIMGGIPYYLSLFEKGKISRRMWTKCSSKGKANWTESSTTCTPPCLRIARII